MKITMLITLILLLVLVLFGCESTKTNSVREGDVVKEGLKFYTNKTQTGLLIHGTIGHNGKVIKTISEETTQMNGVLGEIELKLSIINKSNDIVFIGIDQKPFSIAGFDTGNVKDHWPMVIGPNSICSKTYLKIEPGGRMAAYKFNHNLKDTRTIEIKYWVGFSYYSLGDKANKYIREKINIIVDNTDQKKDQ